MGASFIERLFGIGETPSGEYARVIAGLNPALKVTPLAVDAAGNLNIQPSLSSQTMYNQFRVATLENVFDVRQQFAKDTIYMVESLVGAAASVFLPDEAAVSLNLTTASGDSAIRQTKPYIPYQIGRSQVVVIHFVMGALKANVRQRVGYFDANDGIFLEQDGVNRCVVRRSSTSGSPVDTAIPQAAWNLDKLDGTGPSGLTLDTSKFQVLSISLSWGGEIRVGFAIGGSIINVHQFDNSNVGATIWGSKGSLPVRHEITNLAATASATSLKQMALAVFSEGTIDQLGLLASADNGATTRSIGAASSLPLLSIRLKSTHVRGILLPVAFGVSQTSVKNMRYRLIIGGVLTGASFASVSPAAEVDIAATAVSGGHVVQAGYIPAGAGFGGLSVTSARSSLWAASDFAGTPDNLTLLVNNLDAGSALAHAALQWKEVA